MRLDASHLGVDKRVLDLDAWMYEFGTYFCLRGVVFAMFGCFSHCFSVDIGCRCRIVLWITLVLVDYCHFFSNQIVLALLYVLESRSLPLNWIVWAFMVIIMYV